MKTLSLCLFLMTALFLNPLTQAELRCRETMKSNALETIVRENRFETSRDLVDYLLRFGARFQQRVKALVKGMIWLDVGAGKALAQKDFIQIRTSTEPDRDIDAQNGNWQSARTVIPQRFFWKPTEWPRLIAASFAKPEGYRQKKDSPLQYEVMNWFKEWKRFLSLSGKVNLLTDYYGNLSYTEFLSQDLKSYLQLIARDGAIYISIDKSLTLVQLANGERVDIITWLESIQGISVRRIWTKETLATKPHLSEQGLAWDGDSFEIRLTTEFQNLNWPELQLIEPPKTYASGPPLRIFAPVP